MERDSLQQAADHPVQLTKDPASEKERMERDVGCGSSRNPPPGAVEGSQASEIMASLHELETKAGGAGSFKGEIAFGKHMLSLGFKNENIYTSPPACPRNSGSQERLGGLAGRALRTSPPRGKMQSLYRWSCSRAWAGFAPPWATETPHCARLLDLNRAGALARRDSASVKLYREFCEGPTRAGTLS